MKLIIHRCYGYLPICTFDYKNDGAKIITYGKCQENIDNYLLLSIHDAVIIVNYCPFCGFKSRKQLKLVEKELKEGSIEKNYVTT